MLAVHAGAAEFVIENALVRPSSVDCETGAVEDWGGGP